LIYSSSSGSHPFVILLLELLYICAVCVHYSCTLTEAACNLYLAAIKATISGMQLLMVCLYMCNSLLAFYCNFPVITIKNSHATFY